MAKRIGLLTAGSDCAGMNAAIRGIGKAVSAEKNLELIGFRDGFNGLVEDRTMDLGGGVLSGILTLGGTILGISRNIPQAMPAANGTADLTQNAVDTYKRRKLDALVCIGGKETIKAGLNLSQAGLNVVVLPKAADNDIPGTDKAIGFDTAREIATQAIDRLHSTANATHRIMIVELAGVSAGWLTLGAGLAAGADVILIPEFPYDFGLISAAIGARQKAGRNFSLVAVAENARSQELVEFMERAARKKAGQQSGSDSAVSAEMERIGKELLGRNDAAGTSAGRRNRPAEPHYHPGRAGARRHADCFRPSAGNPIGGVERLDGGDRAVRTHGSPHGRRDEQHDAGGCCGQAQAGARRPRLDPRSLSGRHLPGGENPRIVTLSRGKREAVQKEQAFLLDSPKWENVPGFAWL